MSTRFIASKIFLLILIIVAIFGFYKSFEVAMKVKEKEIHTVETPNIEIANKSLILESIGGEYISTSSSNVIQVTKISNTNIMLNSGKIVGSVVLQGTTGFYHDEANCEANLEFKENNILVVTDNGQCSGVGGGYTKR